MSRFYGSVCIYESLHVVLLDKQLKMFGISDRSLMKLKKSLDNEQVSIKATVVLLCNVSLRPNSITLFSSRAGLRACLRPSSELDSVMEFGQISLCYPAIQLASWSQTWFSTCRRQVRAILTCRDSSNLVAAGSQLFCDQLVRELLASWIAPVRPSSTTLSSSLTDHRPAREPAGKLDSVMEFGLYRLRWLHLQHI